MSGGPRHRLDIHNSVTPEQLALKPGDRVHYLRDIGNTTVHTVKYSGPYQARDGTLVVHLSGIAGYVALCRVTRAD